MVESPLLLLQRYEFFMHIQANLRLLSAFFPRMVRAKVGGQISIAVAVPIER